MSADVQESDSQFRAAWKYFSDRLPAGKDVHLEGLYAVFGGVPVPFFNVLFVEPDFNSEEQLARRLKDGIAWANNEGVPWLLSIADRAAKKLDRTQDVLAAAGFQSVMPLTGMIADELTPAAKVPEDLEFRLARDTENRRAIVDVNSKAYGMPLERSDLDNDRLWDEHSYGVVAYLNGETVSASATLLVDDRLYVAWVATVPEHRRKGYAETAMRRSLEEASKVHGWRRSVLHATPAGRPVYEKMGYRVVEEYMLYGLGH